MNKLLATTALLVSCCSCGANSALAPPPAGSGGFSDRASAIYFAWGKSGGKQLRSYPATANGNVAPTTVIGGMKTMLDGPSLVSIAPAGALYTCNLFFGRILGFAPNLRGNVPPTRNIGGSNNPIKFCRSVAVESGRIAAVGLPPPGSEKEYTIYLWASGLNGNVKPSRAIAGPATELDGPAAMAFDASGNLYVANEKGNSVTVYDRNAAGNAPPIRTLAGRSTGLSGPSALAIDQRTGLLYVANSSSGNGAITAYELTQSGNAAPEVVIKGSETGLDRPVGVAVDGAGFIYVSNFPYPGGFFTVYKPGSNGNAAPIQTIKGSKVHVSGQIAVR